MNTLNPESSERPLRTSDLAAAASRSTAQEEPEQDRDEREQDRDERLAPLFSADVEIGRAHV